MSKNRACAPTRLPIALHRRHPDRPAWQSPYGPPPRRTHRGRWAPVPGLAEALSTARRGNPRDRCA
ncbi:hypothetical protein VT50_0226930 [Streptomyces antioxidans]|uniref:Uncharacterized protein n=1 Tax=Streptomyces antioxidans TaxID=1507734 RepID=A0A1V4CZC0_9ACTN|nr:hypothetical protein [Streptomyces antioxidans]OPF74240.1 hypothetical protein VT50_0226930 [Streptomyces antioxidans]